MKPFTLISVLLFVCIVSAGQPTGKYKKDITLRFVKRSEERLPDSVWVIFDRYDRTGPGVVNKIYSPQRTNPLVINVPAGKYFIDVICFGKDRKQHLTTISTIGKRRKNIVKFRLEPMIPYIPGTAVIPRQKVDFSRLKIFRMLPSHKLQ